MQELAEKKKEMARIIEISNKAYEARDAAQSEMAALKAQADKEQEEFEREWKELGKMIEQDRKMKDFMKKARAHFHRMIAFAAHARTATPRVPRWRSCRMRFRLGRSVRSCRTRSIAAT